jgi:hypothetical protein
MMLVAALLNGIEAAKVGVTAAAAVPTSAASMFSPGTAPAGAVAIAEASELSTGVAGSAVVPVGLSIVSIHSVLKFESRVNLSGLV